MQAKGYRVGPVYDDVLAMAWFFLELIVKSMALEKTRLFYHSLPTGIFKFAETYSCHLLGWLLLITMLFLHLYLVDVFFTMKLFEIETISKLWNQDNTAIQD